MTSDAQRTNTLVDQIEQHDALSAFRSLLDEADLTDTLREDGPYTVFAPTATAIETWREDEPWRAQKQEPAPVMDLEDEEEEETERAAPTPAEQPSTRQLVRAHVLEGHYTIPALTKEHTMRSVAGTALDIRREGPRLRIGPARIQGRPLKAENGVVYVVDRVLPTTVK
jgi:uncharacterized surface protein with fasciclin (FAS1) repeats